MDDLSLLWICYRPEEGAGQLPDLQEQSRKAGAAFKQKQYETASQLYAELVECDSMNSRFIYNYGAALARLGKLQDAEGQMERLSLRNPTDVDALLALADLNRRQNHPAAAQNYLNRVRILSPGDRRLEKLENLL